MPAPDRAEARALLEELYAAAVGAAAPGPALDRALARVVPVGPVRLFALGKASLAMAETAVAALTARGRSPAGGVVGVDPCRGPHAVEAAGDVDRGPGGGHVGADRDEALDPGGGARQRADSDAVEAVSDCQKHKMTKTFVVRL